MSKNKGLSVDKAAAVELLVSMGFKTATNFNAERIVKKFKQIAEKDTADLECSNKKLLDKIVSALENEEELTITEEDEDEKPAKKSEKADKPKADKKSKKSEDEDEEDDEDEDEDEEDEKPAKKDKKADKPKAEKKADKKGEKKPKGEGVIGVIAKILLAASEKKPITKDAIVEKLTEKFEDRDPDSMRGTVNVQVPSRISKERNITVRKNDKGYWAVEGRDESEAEKPAKSDKKSEKADKKKADKKASKKDDEDEDE